MIQTGQYIQFDTTMTLGEFIENLKQQGYEIKIVPAGQGNQVDNDKSLKFEWIAK